MKANFISKVCVILISAQLGISVSSAATQITSQTDLERVLNGSYSIVTSASDYQGRRDRPISECEMKRLKIELGSHKVTKSYGCLMVSSSHLTKEEADRWEIPRFDLALSLCEKLTDYNLNMTIDPQNRIIKSEEVLTNWGHIVDRGDRREYVGAYGKRRLDIQLSKDAQSLHVVRTEIDSYGIRCVQDATFTRDND